MNTTKIDTIHNLFVLTVEYLFFMIALKCMCKYQSTNDVSVNKCMS